MAIFIKSKYKWFFIIHGENNYLFRNPETDGEGESYFFSDVLGGDRKEGAAVFMKDEAKRIINYLKSQGYKNVRMARQEGLLVKDGKAYEEHNQGQSNYDKDGNYIHAKKEDKK